MFCFKQKTAYEMRISDWSSDVCSSDLYFREEIMPVLSPLGLDPAHPFPKILNQSLNLVVVLKGKDAFGRSGHLALVREPRSLPRTIQMPKKDHGAAHTSVFLSPVPSTFGER